MWFKTKYAEPEPVEQTQEETTSATWAIVKSKYPIGHTFIYQQVSLLVVHLSDCNECVSCSYSDNRGKLHMWEFSTDGELQLLCMKQSEWGKV